MKQKVLISGTEPQRRLMPQSDGVFFVFTSRCPLSRQADEHRLCFSPAVDFCNPVCYNKTVSPAAGVPAEPVAASINQEELSMVNKLKQHIRESFVGKEEIVENVLICLLSGGHILLEGVPGVGKTTLASALARSVACDFGRIQFTPDTLPTDVMGTEIFNMKTGEFEYREGAVMHQIVGNLVRHDCGRGSAAFRIDECKGGIIADPPHHIHCLQEILLRLSRETDDQIGRQGDIRYPASDPVNQIQVGLLRIVPVHLFQQTAGT